MKIAVKYCGGCNPCYDRVALVNSLKAEFYYERFVDYTTPADLVIVVCGCTSSCADHLSIFADIGKFIITKQEDYEKLRQWVGLKVEQSKGKNLIF